MLISTIIPAPIYCPVVRLASKSVPTDCSIGTTGMSLTCFTETPSYSVAQLLNNSIAKSISLYDCPQHIALITLICPLLLFSIQSTLQAQFAFDTTELRFAAFSPIMSFTDPFSIVISMLILQLYWSLFLTFPSSNKVKSLFRAFLSARRKLNLLVSSTVKDPLIICFKNTSHPAICCSLFWSKNDFNLLMFSLLHIISVKVKVTS